MGGRRRGCSMVWSGEGREWRQGVVHVTAVFKV
jgi:hypothetical protein